MTTDELKTEIEQWRKHLREKSGKAVLYGESGPANMSVIDAIVATLEKQEARIRELATKLGN